MKDIELMREALDTGMLIMALDEISHLSERDQIRAIKLVLKNRDLIDTAIAVLRYGIDDVRRNHPDSVVKLISSGLIPPERLMEKEPDRPRTPRNEMPGRVYLMRNNKNNLIKIGFSKNPKVREATLQSEEPDITLICHWPGCMKDELRLHKHYASKRRRGEWFELTDKDVSCLSGEF